MDLTLKSHHDRFTDMSNPTTYIETTPGTETHEVEVLSHRTFRGTLVRHRKGFGPVLAEVVVTRATVLTGDRAGTVCHPTFSVRVDGEHLFGGMADHMSPEGLPKMSPVVFGTEIIDEVPEEPLYAPAEESAIVKLALAMGEYGQHRDARNNAGKVRESKAEQIAEAKVDGMSAIIADCMSLAATPFAARCAIAYAWGYAEATYDRIAGQGNREAAYFLRSCWVAEVLDRFAHDTARTR